MLSRFISKYKKPFLTLLMTRFLNHLLSLTHFYSLEPQLNDNVFNFDHEPDIAAEVQDKIDWVPFKGQGAPLPFLLNPYFLLTKNKIPLPFALLSLISTQRIMRDCNHHPHSQVPYRPHSSLS
jgi:hypothetical protein